MTQQIVIFDKTGSHAISVMDYSEQFATNLSNTGVKYRVENIGPEEYFWGDFATGQVYDKHEKPLIDELAIDTIINKEILVKYPVHAQLNIIADCIEKAGIPLTDDFVEMRDFIKQKVENHNTAKQVYQENPEIYAFWPKPDATFDRNKY
jgi:hypothetical protein